MSDFVSVIIVNYNAGARLQKCLAHLTRQTHQSFEVIVFDNASTDGSVKQAVENAGDLSVKFIEHDENIGFAAGNNRAVDEAKGEWIAFLNPDAYAAPTWLEELVTATKNYPNTDAFGSTQINAGNPNLIDGAGDAFHVLGMPYRCFFGADIKELPPEDRDVFSPCAAAALYKTSTFNALGGFDEDLFCYTEDVDLGFRLRLAGGTVMQIAQAVVHHEGSGVTGRYSDFTVYYGNRNRIWVAFTDMPGLYYILLCPFQLALNVLFIPRAFKLGAGRAYLRSLKDGYRELPKLYAKRRRIQQHRKARTADVMKMMTWSPTKLFNRKA